ncbi:Protein interacting with poly(A)-binding protein [Pseudoloma neurophilia]|uniref:Protein interacting with poly(A)-binding protein n=1 Tax=Pseudoloma neurophilia TaxID=146866 RepID=A0A0R0M843_9MICR|nr:Protein interacting with poly(A)-binding protein [Pseudoloma neurophilia]
MKLNRLEVKTKKILIGNLISKENGEITLDMAYFEDDPDLKFRITISEKDVISFKAEQKIESPKTKYDQFKKNEEVYGIKMKFEESVYTTILDKESKFYKENVEEAKRIEREIQADNSKNKKEIEDEETRYSAVIGKKFRGRKGKRERFGDGAPDSGWLPSYDAKNDQSSVKPHEKNRFNRYQYSGTENSGSRKTNQYYTNENTDRRGIDHQQHKSDGFKSYHSSKQPQYTRHEYSKDDSRKHDKSLETTPVITKDNEKQDKKDHYSKTDPDLKTLPGLDTPESIEPKQRISLSEKMSQIRSKFRKQTVKKKWETTSNLLPAISKAENSPFLRE